MELQRHIRNHHGLISRADAQELGLSIRQIERRTAQGQWIPEQRGVYRDATHPRTWDLRLRAAVQAARGIAFGRCATVLWGLGIFSEPPIEVAIDHRFRRSLRGATVHRSTHWDLNDKTLRRGIACSGIERTLLDTAAVAGTNLTERLLESALRQELTTTERVLEHLQHDGARGRPGTATLRAVIDRRGTRNVTLSDFSDRVVQLLRENGLAMPEVEYRIIDNRQQFVMQADLAWPSSRRVVELDGLEWHFGRRETERDRLKRAKARALGWRIMEITWEMFDKRTDELVDLLADFLSEWPAAA